ncbi:translin-associated factor X-interacting protein 1-like [Littorina saxatilis]|uniref:Translin-associated factor X-interacting protein 1 N-terminal domain-containing protein n=1 Tax=Littorina saxatilis TaxID=31220 RepID=A0AAN9C023_9CAEN
MSDGKLTLARLPPLGPRGVHHDQSRLESFSGQPYRLNGNVHPLPPAKALRPYNDTKAGEVDTWPAHASGLALSASAAMLSKNKSLVIMSEEDGGKAPMIPKPRFLEQLENFLKKELRALGVTEVTPSDLRLQAHREVFEYLIEDFKTYKPLLSAIKNEYEMMLAFQRQQIRQLEPLKQMLVTVSEQCDQKVMALRDEERQEIAALKTENRSLYIRISTMVNEQKDLEEQVSRLQETLREEHQKYRDECDARKLLIADINDLRYQQEDYMASKQSNTDQEVTEDPVMLKLALKKAREDEKAASVRLNEMIANYGDVIPRREFEALEKNYKEVEKHAEANETDFLKLQAEHNALLDIQKHVISQRDQFYLELETLKRSSTPRPDWEKCADFVQGGITRWQELSDGKASNELVDVLLHEISAGGFVESAGADYFEGQGTGPEIPKYLRFVGQVRNRRLGKRDTLLLIRDIWREKAASDAERDDGTREKMWDFLYSYLQRRFSMEQMVIEWGYNLHDACQRYSHDENIGLFWKILNDEADEEVFHEELQLIHTILAELTKVDADQGNSGKLERSLFQTTLEAILPGMDEETIATMMRAVETEQDEKDQPEVDYKYLFTEDDEGKTGLFLDEVKKFAKRQKAAYVSEIKEQLGDTSPVSVDDLKRALTMADPEMDTTTMDAYVTWTFNATLATLGDAEPMEQSKLLERLQNGTVKRIGKKM